MLQDIIEQINETLKVVAEQQEIFDNLGRVVRGIYNGFINAGFTSEQALTLTASMSNTVKQNK